MSNNTLSAPIEFLLPNETLTAIFDSLPQHVLADLTRVSHHFCAVAERVLYTSIYIRDVLANADHHPWRTLRCCESLLLRPHLLESIRIFHIRWSSMDGASVESSLQFSTTLAKLSELLPTLISLESLELSLGPANMMPGHPGGSHPIERAIVGCQFPNLRTCILGADWAKGVQPYSTALGHFLSSLHSLRHLKLGDHHGALHVPNGTLPVLSSFRGSTDTAATILPGRPVQSLSLVGQDSDVTRDNIFRLTQTTLPLRCLDLSGMSVRPMLLRNLATYLPMLEVIRIRLTLRHTLHYALSGIVSLSSSMFLLLIGTPRKR